MEACNTNIVDCLRRKNIVAIASGQYEYERVPQNALFNDNSLDFCSDYKIDSFWEIDFQRYVMITSYSIRAPKALGWIYNWNVSMSTNHKTWNFVHRKTNTECSSSPSFSTSYNAPIRYFRIKTAGLSYNSNSPNIAFQYISFQGSINYTPIAKQKCFTQNRTHYRSMLNLIVFVITCAA